MTQSERMAQISRAFSRNWLGRALCIACIFLLLTPGVIHTSHSWQRFSQYDPIVSSLTFNHNANINNNNNKQQPNSNNNSPGSAAGLSNNNNDNSLSSSNTNSNHNNNNNNNNNLNDGSAVIGGPKSSNTGSVKHFNYRHIALGAQSGTQSRQGSWKKWIPQPSSLSSPSSSSSSSSSLYSSSASSSLYPPYNPAAYRSRQQQQHNIGADLHDNNCSRFERQRNCHECRRHDCSFLQCDGPELSSTICLNVASPAFFSSPSIHKVLSQCHFIETCPASSQLSSSWLDSTNDGDTSSSTLLSGSESGSLPSSSLSSSSSSSNLVLSLYPSAQSPNSNSDSLSSSSSSSSSSYSQRNPFELDSKSNSEQSVLPYYYPLSHRNHTTFDGDDDDSGGGGALQRERPHLKSLDKRQKGQKGLQAPQNRKRVAMHHYSAQTWRHGIPDGAPNSILSSPLAADDHRGRITTFKSGNNQRVLSPSAGAGAAHIGLGTIIALMLCSALVLSAVLTVAYKKITRIYRRNSHSSAYGVLQEE